MLLLGTAVVAALTLSTTALGDPVAPVRIERVSPATPPSATPPANGATAGTSAARTTSPRASATPTSPALPVVSSTTRSSAPCPAPPSVVRSTAPGKGRTVALTFDDGPSPYTTKVLGALAREHVHATFFVIGQQVRARAATLAQVVRAGHLVGDHSWDHSYPSSVPGGWSPAYLRRSLVRTNTAVEKATGRVPCWFRPPGGFLPRSVLPAARAQRMGVVLWSVDTRDWAVESTSHPTAARRTAMTRAIVHAALAGLSQRHPIVLLHDGGGYRGATVQAIPEIIAKYRAAGYRFVRLDGRR